MRLHDRSEERAISSPRSKIVAGPPSVLLALALLAPLLAAAGVAPRVAQPAQGYDVLIRDGRVLDGSGNPWFRADVAVEGDRIAAIGDLRGATAGIELDATGLYVAPGYIDVHSHAAGGLANEQLAGAETLLYQGVTTVVINPDGRSPDIGEQRDEMLAHGIGVNAAPMVGHGSTRGDVIGSDDRQATPAELERMREIVRAGMEEGAFGLSSGLFYAPGSYAELSEVIALAEVAAEYGGVYASHIRDEADYTIGVVAAVDEVIEVARRAGIPGVVTHVKALGPNVWGESRTIVEHIEAARTEGVEMYADQYPYEASSTGLSAALLPRWSQAGGGEALAARFADPETRARIRAAMVENLARRGGAGRIQFVSGEGIEGRTLQDLADEQAIDPIDVAVELLTGGGGGSIISHNMDAADVHALMVQPWTMTASDGGLPRFGAGKPHPRSYGTFPRKIRMYVLEEEVLPLAAAIRSMTSLPATAFRIADRGVLRAGAFADVAVFDLARVRDLATYEDPHQYAEGVVHLLVNGQVAIRDGQPTGVRAGRALRRNETMVQRNDGVGDRREPGVMPRADKTADGRADGPSSTTSSGSLGDVLQDSVGLAGDASGNGQASVTSDGWPQWGGPQRNFMVDAFDLAESWPAGGPRELWSRPLGLGHSTIAVDEGLLFTMYRPAAGDGAQFAGREAVIALDGATGETVWEHAYPARPLNFNFGAGPHSTPLIVGERLFTAGTNKQIHALDKRSGEVLWSHDLVAEYGAPPTLIRPAVKAGYACSPLAWGDLVIVTAGGEGQSVMAFRQDDGALAWSGGDFLIAPSSPILIDVGGQTQLVVVGGQSVNGLDPDTGEVLWSHPHDTDGDMNNTTAVWGDDDVLFVSAAYDSGSRALRLTRTAAGTTVEELWHTRDMQVMFGSTIRLGDFIYGSSGGFGPAFISALDLTDGSIAWRERGFARGSLLYAGGKVLILDEDGALALAAVSPEGLTVHARAEVLTGTAWTAPTLVETTLYLRDRQVIKALDLGG
jgi:N-acyl-D-aspartate/D-glutamate deacylase/outer membrane protein assembly factor BamB